MVAAVVIRGDLREIRRALKEEPKIARKAAISAINKTASQAQTKATRDLAAKKKLPQRLVRNRVKFKRANLRQLYATIITLTAGLPVDKLNFRSLKRGGIMAAGRKFPHAFTWQPGNRPLVFERRVIGGQRVGRLPIDRLKIELNPEADRIFGEKLRTYAYTVLPRLFEHEMQFRLRRRAA